MPGFRDSFLAFSLTSIRDDPSRVQADAWREIRFLNEPYQDNCVELSQLISFYHVARLGSVSRAAGIVFRTQPAVSQQIRALEEELGCRLLHRIGRRRLVPTPEGERLWRFAADLIRQVDQTVQDIHSIQGGERGHVRIAAPFTTCFHVLPETIKRFRDRYPQARVTVLDRPQEAALALVKEGEADFAIALDSAVPRGQSVEGTQARFLKALLGE